MGFLGLIKYTRDAHAIAQWEQWQLQVEMLGGDWDKAKERALLMTMTSTRRIEQSMKEVMDDIARGYPQ